MLAIKTSAVVTPEVNLKNPIHEVRKHTSEGSTIHPGFEIQASPEVQDRDISGPLMSPNNFFDFPKSYLIYGISILAVADSGT